jgi:phosphohistidine phosphatase
MNLYILRHAIAKDRAGWKKPDSLRPLTSKGKRKMQKAAKGLKHLDLGVDWILTSPYRRAYDTTAIVAKALKAKKKMKVVKSLASDGEPSQLVKELAKGYRSTDSLMLVGHEPYLSKLVSVLVGSERPLALDFKKGGLCRLDTQSLRYGPCATLEWWLSPKLLKKL